jgi:hypothetical protein
MFVSLSEDQRQYGAIESIRDIGFVSIRKRQAATVQLHHHIGVVQTDAHAIWASTEEGAGEALWVILKTCAIVRNDNSRSTREVFFDVDVYLSSGLALVIRPAYLEPIECVVEKVVQSTQQQAEREVSFDIR